MKDKLVKHNHKKSYFILKKIIILFSLFVLISGAIAIPLTINAIKVNNTSINIDEL